MTEWIVSASVLIAVMAVLRRVLKGKLNPRLQYALWAIVLARLLIPVSLFNSSLSVQNVRDEVMDRPEVRQVYSAVSAPIPVENYDRVYREVVREYEAKGVDVAEMEASDVQTEVYSRMDTISVQEVLTIVWIAGMAVMTLWLIGCNAQFALRLRRSRTVLDVAFSPIPVYITDMVETPCLFGLFRPTIYLTQEAAEDEQVKRYVLTHEITHYQQFDHIWAILRAVCLVLHWYNPLVWLAFRLSRQDGEMACDEGTLMILGEEHRGNYGRTLIALATQTRLRGSLVTATTMADGKKAIKERIVILMKNPKTAFVTMIALILVCTLVVGCTFTGSIQGEIKENGEGREPAETTIPEETTLPPETTEPGLQTEPTEPADPFAEYYELLKYSKSRNWMNIALGCEFAVPEDVDLEMFFYPGIETPRYWEYLNQNEERFLAELDLGGGFFAIMSVSQIEEIVQSTFGLSLDDFTCGIPESWHYFQETDSYYVHYDTQGSEMYQYTIEALTIEGVELLDGKLVRVYYTPNDSSSYLNGQLMALTLRDTGDGGYTAVSNQKVVSEDQAYTTLTLEQLDQVHTAFDDILYRDDDEKTTVNPLNNFFSCYYNSPAEIDLRDFVWYFCYQSIKTSEEDFNLLAEKYPELEKWRNSYNLSRYPADVVDEVMYENTGYHLEDLYGTRDLSTVYYLEETDSYYSFASDAGWSWFDCVGGRIYDGYVELYSQDAVLTLREENGRYYIYSHLPKEAP